MDNNDTIKDNQIYTVLDWIRLFDCTLPRDREKAVDAIVRQFRVCEGYCPFAPNRRKGFCFNERDPFCIEWAARGQRDEDGNINEQKVYRINRKIEQRKARCWDTWYKFLGVPLDEDIFAKFREKLE